MLVYDLIWSGQGLEGIMSKRDSWCYACKTWIMEDYMESLDCCIECFKTHDKYGEPRSNNGYHVRMKKVYNFIAEMTKGCI